MQSSGFAIINCSPASALISLWRNAIQVVLSIVVAYLLIYPLHLKRLIGSSELFEEPGEDQNEEQQEPPHQPGIAQ